MRSSIKNREKRKKKMNNTLLFSRFGKPKNIRKLLAKEEGEEVQEYVQRFCVKDVKEKKNMPPIVVMTLARA